MYQSYHLLGRTPEHGVTRLLASFPKPGDNSMVLVRLTEKAPEAPPAPMFKAAPVTDSGDGKTSVQTNTAPTTVLSDPKRTFRRLVVTPGEPHREVILPIPDAPEAPMFKTETTPDKKQDNRNKPSKSQRRVIESIGDQLKLEFVKQEEIERTADADTNELQNRLSQLLTAFTFVPTTPLRCNLGDNFSDTAIRQWSIDIANDTAFVPAADRTVRQRVYYRTLQPDIEHVMLEFIVEPLVQSAPPAPMPKSESGDSKASTPTPFEQMSVSHELAIVKAISDQLKINLVPYEKFTYSKDDESPIQAQLARYLDTFEGLKQTMPISIYSEPLVDTAVQQWSMDIQAAKAFVPVIDRTTRQRVYYRLINEDCKAAMTFIFEPVSEEAPPAPMFKTTTETATAATENKKGDSTTGSQRFGIAQEWRHRTVIQSISDRLYIELVIQEEIELDAHADSDEWQDSFSRYRTAFMGATYTTPMHHDAGFGDTAIQQWSADIANDKAFVPATDRTVRQRVLYRIFHPNDERVILAFTVEPLAQAAPSAPMFNLSMDVRTTVLDKASPIVNAGFPGQGAILSAISDQLKIDFIPHDDRFKKDGDKKSKKSRLDHLVNTLKDAEQTIPIRIQAGHFTEVAIQKWPLSIQSSKAFVPVEKRTTRQRVFYRIILAGRSAAMSFTVEPMSEDAPPAPMFKTEPIKDGVEKKTTTEAAAFFASLQVAADKFKWNQMYPEGKTSPFDMDFDAHFTAHTSLKPGDTPEAPPAPMFKTETTPSAEQPAVFVHPNWLTTNELAKSWALLNSLPRDSPLRPQIMKAHNDMMDAKQARPAPTPKGYSGVAEAPLGPMFSSPRTATTPVVAAGTDKKETKSAAAATAQPIASAVPVPISKSKSVSANNDNREFVAHIEFRESAAGAMFTSARVTDIVFVKAKGEFDAYRFKLYKAGPHDYLPIPISAGFMSVHLGKGSERAPECWQQLVKNKRSWDDGCRCAFTKSATERKQQPSGLHYDIPKTLLPKMYLPGAFIPGMMLINSTMDRELCQKPFDELKDEVKLQLGNSTTSNIAWVFKLKKVPRLETIMRSSATQQIYTHYVHSAIAYVRRGVYY